jgi:hypothetical protein
MKKRSLFGLLNVKAKTKNTQEEEKRQNNITMGHSIDPEKMEFTEYNISDESEVIFPT